MTIHECFEQCVHIHCIYTFFLLYNNLTQNSNVVCKLVHFCFSQYALFIFYLQDCDLLALSYLIESLANVQISDLQDKSLWVKQVDKYKTIVSKILLQPLKDQDDENHLKYRYIG